MSSRILAALCGVILSAAGVGSAATIPIVNPGFELQFVADGSFIDNGAPTGWTPYDPHGLIGSNYNSLGVLNPTDTPLYPNDAPQGTNVALIFLWPQTVPQENLPAGIQQTLGDNLEANTQYTLTVQVGNIAVGGAAPFDLNGFPGYQVQLLAGGVVLALDNNTLAPAEGQFLLSTVQFTTGASHAQLNAPLSIRLINLGAANSGIEVNYDEVELEATAVPEPSAAMLLVLGLLTLGSRAKRKDCLTGH